MEILGVALFWLYKHYWCCCWCPETETSSFYWALLSRFHLKTEIESSLQKKNSMVWVRERTIPIERPPLLGEVVANFCGERVPRGQRNGSLRPYSRFSGQEPLLFYQVAPQLYSRGWVDPVPDPLLVFLSSPPPREIWVGRGANPGFRICSQELWPLDHRGGLQSSKRRVLNKSQDNG
jgi:hypothetical protein